jgi:DNA-binding PadR family transcriptional regulator
VTSKRIVANPLALAVLALLIERPMHPYEIAATMRERHMHESIKLNYGSLYTVVDTLQRRKLIEPLETSRDGRRPERTVYDLTDAGRAEFGRWLRELVSEPVKEYPQFAAGISLMGRLPVTEIADLLEERLERLEAQTREKRVTIQALREIGLPRSVLVESEYDLAMHEAEMQWIRATIQDIRDGEIFGEDEIRLKDGTLIWQRPEVEEERA